MRRGHARIEACVPRFRMVWGARVKPCRFVSFASRFRAIAWRGEPA